MNAVVSYSDFQEYMYYSSGQSEIIPIILIKPSVIQNSLRNYSLDQTFEYFHYRSGDEIIFFLPGYAQYPRFEAGEFLSRYRPYDNTAIAFSIQDRKWRRDIYYSYQAFTEFVDVLEERSNGFRYYGNTELLFVKFNRGDRKEDGDIDFNAIHRFDLTQIYLTGGSESRGYHNVESFLERVYQEFRRFLRNGDTEAFYKKIEDAYKNL